MKHKKNRSLKTIRRDNAIHEAYNSLITRGGDFAKAVSRKFIYQSLARETGYSTRTIAEILNHTQYTPTTFLEE
uniref:hypothetical protein n=1 Tax=Alistipes sp. TaxID=1872444 RepID=UPI0040575D7B